LNDEHGSSILTLAT